MSAYLLVKYILRLHIEHGAKGEGTRLQHTFHLLQHIKLPLEVATRVRVTGKVAMLQIEVSARVDKV